MHGKGHKVIQPLFYSASEVAEILGVSKNHAYSIIKKLNVELTASGKIIVAGKVSIRYFNEKIYI